MQNVYKKIAGQKKRALLSGFLTFVMVFVALVRLMLSVSADKVGENGNDPLNLDCKSAVLMEESTGIVLYEKNADAICPPASITKIMTLLLVFEAIDEGKLSMDDMVTASAHACSMGGSQIYLKEGETMRAEDLIKSVVISSANDAALALAEHLMGSEEAFVTLMNQRAAELGMKNTHFENTNGLDDTVENHVTTARDVAIMSRALMAHPAILTYSSTWMDTIRNGAFGLTNTNRLIRFYPGATGLKTGSTSKAKFCISATAKRDNMSLICVIMGAETRDIRNEQAKRLLDYGFSNYELFSYEGKEMTPVSVVGGTQATCSVKTGSFSCVLPKGEGAKVEAKITMDVPQTAPVREGDAVGKVEFVSGERILGDAPIVATETVEKIGFGGLLWRMLLHFVVKC